MDGSRIIFGAPKDDADYGTDCGSAFIYHYHNGGWLLMPHGHINHPNQSAGDSCGASVDIDGDYAVVGCPTADPDSVQNAGAAYVYHWTGSTWSMQEMLTASDKGTGDQFGRSVAISGSRIVVGAPHWDSASNQGTFYIFNRSGSDWSQYQGTSYVASDGAADDNFGWSTDIDGSFVVVGAPGNDAAYVFQYTRLLVWQQVRKMDGGTYTQDGDYFGFSVALAGSFAIVGSPYEDYDGVPPDNWTLRGAAYIFDRYKSGDAWGEVEYLLGAAESYSMFGYSVDIDNYSGDDHYAVVGSPYRDAGGYTNSGEARVFYRYSDSYWPLDYTGTSSQYEASQYCGVGVAVGRGDDVVDAVMGCPYNDYNYYADVGAADLFEDI